MSGFLRQATASQTRTIGPFLDSTDFKTDENALTIANTDIKLKKNGAASGNKNSGGATADGEDGLYAVTWDATDTATVGELHYSVLVAGALVVWGVYTVVEEAVYDALFAASAAGFGVAQTGDAFARLGAPTGASIAADIAAVAAKTGNLPGDPADASDIAALLALIGAVWKKNTALSNFTFGMEDAAGPATGLTVTAVRSIDGAVAAPCANAVSEVGGGLYKINLAAADLNGRVIAFKFSATGAKARMFSVITQGS